MKTTKRFLSIIFAFVLTFVMTFTLPNDNLITSNAATTATEISLADNVQDGVILHAWNWSYNTIKNNLADIYAAGYTTVQTSPVQQPKDYSRSYTDVGGQWWKLYQPVSLSIASSSWLGTKSDLTALCSAADNYGIKIICDIVANHLGSGNGNGGLSTQVATYESDIYNNTGSTLWNSSVPSGDYSVEAVVRSTYGSRPDLNTANVTVQKRVISLLKECIDCGVDGFRWDMAKHIETLSDGYFASNFWANVIGPATTYAQSTKGITLYNYGEILNTPGSGRNNSDYTPYMSITDNVTSNNIRNAVNNADGANAKSNYYCTGVPANKIVLWAESHDTYTEGSSSGTSDHNINQTWAIVASRTEATSLYFARPGSATMGNMGSTNWKSTEVTAVNKLHNAFIGGCEYLSNSGRVVMNERYFTNNNNTYGAVLVNCSGGSTSVNMTVNKLVSGQYTDLVSGNVFIVENGKISGTIGNTGIAVFISNMNPVKDPIATSSAKSQTFKTSITTTLSLSNATSGTYHFDNETPTTFTGSETITFGSDWPDGTTKTLYLTATNGTKTTETSYTFTKDNGVIPTTITLYFTNNYSWNNLHCYYWGGSAQSMSWPGVYMTYVRQNEYNESVYKIEVPSDITGIIFNNGSNSYQTIDITSGMSNGLGYYLNGTSSGKYTVGTYTYTE